MGKSEIVENGGRHSSYFIMFLKLKYADKLNAVLHSTQRILQIQQQYLILY